MGSMHLHFMIICYFFFMFLSWGYYLLLVIKVNIMLKPGLSFFLLQTTSMCMLWCKWISNLHLWGMFSRVGNDSNNLVSWVHAEVHQEIYMYITIFYQICVLMTCISKVKWKQNLSLYDPSNTKRDYFYQTEKSGKVVSFLDIRIFFWTRMFQWLRLHLPCCGWHLSND